MSRRRLLACALSLAAAAPVGAQEVELRMATLLSEPRPGHLPHPMISIQDFLAKRIAFHTDGEVELVVLEGDDARIPVRRTSQGDWDFVPAWLGGELAASGNVVNAASLPPFLYDTPELMVTAIPYLFSGMEHTRRYPGSAAAARVAEAFARDYPGARLVGNFLVAVDMSVNTRGEFFTDLEDFEGTIVQDFDPYWRDMWEGHMPAEFADCGFECAAEGYLLGDGWRSKPNETRAGERLRPGIPRLHTDVAEDRITGPVDVNLGLFTNNFVQRLFVEYDHNNYVPHMFAIFYNFVVNAEVLEGMTPFQRRGLEAAIRDTEFAAFTFTAAALREHYALQQERGVRLRIQTPSERREWREELRPRVEAIYRGEVGDGADRILDDVAALDDRFPAARDASEPAVVLRMASLINQPGPPTPTSHHMSFTHARLMQLVDRYSDGEVRLHEMTEAEQEAEGWFAPFFIVDGVSKGTVEAADMPSFFFRPAPFPPFHIDRGGYLVDVQSQAFVFDSIEHQRRFLDSEVEALVTSEIEEAFPGLRVLGYFTIGSDVAINSNVGPIRTPTDVCGHRITPGFETWRRLFDAACERAGLEPVTDLSDVIDTDGAFRGAHLREGNEINIGMFQNGYGQSLGEWGDLTYLPSLYNIFYTFAIHESTWRGMTEGQRAAIERAVEETQKAAFGYQIDGLLVKQGLMQAQGANVHYVSRSERSAWKEFFAPSVDAWVDEAPDPAAASALLGAIRGLREGGPQHPALPAPEGELEPAYGVR